MLIIIWLIFNIQRQKGGYHIAPTIQELLCLLDEDNSNECAEWARQIRKNLR